jgi:predicted phage terminase large subunit-like protein
MLHRAVTAEVVEGIVNSCLKKNFDKPVSTPECHREWWRLCCDPYKFVAIAAPRGHAKSTAITHSYTIANMVFRTATFILVVSDTETQATFFLNDIKKELTENEDLIKMFGIKGLIKDAVADFIIEFEDGQQARVIAKGSGQSLRGVKWNGKRPDLIIGDDLENDDIVLNKERREKFRRWVSGVLLPCRSKDGLVRLVGTILHQDSQLERLMPQENRKNVVVEELCVKFGPNNPSAWKAIKYKAHNKGMTKCLWPEYKSLEWLKAERQTYIDQGALDVWSQEMLNVPLDEEHATFRRQDFKDMLDEDHKQQFNYYVSSDLALTHDQQRDYCAFIVGAVDSAGKLYIPHVIHQRMQSDEIEETIFLLNETYKPEMFFFEKGQIWLSLQPHLTNGMVTRDKYFSFEALPSITEKVSRCSSIRARMRVGAVKFDKKQEWWPDFEEECLKFPRGTHDDQVDALSLLGRGLNRFSEAATDKETADEEFEESKRDGGFFEMGRNETTGY